MLPLKALKDAYGIKELFITYQAVSGAGMQESLT